MAAHIPNDQAGFTLIELVVYVAIVGVLLLSIVSFYGLVIDVRVKNQSIAEVNQQGQLAMDGITQTIRNATSITTPALASSGAALTLVVPTGSLSPTVFKLNGTALQITAGVSTPVALTGSKVQISSLTFKNLTRAGTNGIVQVSFVISRTNNTGRATYDYQKTFTTSAEIGW